MRRRRAVLARACGTVALSVVVAACGDPSGPGDDGGAIDELPRALTAAERALIAGSNTFGVDLTARVAAMEEGPNVVLSPLSASMALGMALNGAGGATFDGMREALRFGELSQAEINESYRDLLDLLSELDPAVELTVANSAWANEGFPFEQAFFDAVREYFAAEVQSLDFGDPATLAAINGWVDDRTGGRIDRMLEKLDPELMLLLVNAVYFEGKWTARFDPDQTRPGSFTRDDGSTAEVDMMRMEDARVRYGASPRAGVVGLELPYGGGAWTMVLALPSSGTARERLASMDAAAWDALIGSFEEQVLDLVSIPRFSVAYDALLNDPLSEMGMGRAFTADADFRAISPRAACIDFVRQKAFIEVDEAGTTAAAATVVGVRPDSFFGFVADRPFLFAIRERLSGTLLFTGVIGDPTREEAEPPETPPACTDRRFEG